jgi:hypothetical protein
MGPLLLLLAALLTPGLGALLWWLLRAIVGSHHDLPRYPPN